MEIFKKHSNKISAVLLAIFILLSSVFGYLKLTNQTIGLNMTESLPQTLFLVKKDEPFSKGDTIQFAHISDERNFIPTGAKLIKIVIGSAGDVVSFSGQDFFINGVQYGTAKMTSMKGESLTKNVSKVLEDGEYFVYTSHLDSFDSRYIHVGYIKDSQVIGKVVGAW